MLITFKLFRDRRYLNVFYRESRLLKAISEHFFVCLICIKTSVQESETSGPVVTGFQVGGLLTDYLLYNLLPC